MITNKENKLNLSQPNSTVSTYQSDANSDARIREAAEFTANILMAVLRLYTLAFQAGVEEDNLYAQSLSGAMAKESDDYTDKAEVSVCESGEIQPPYDSSSKPCAVNDSFSLEMECLTYTRLTLSSFAQHTDD